VSIDLTPIIEAVIALLAAIVTYKLVPWIRARTTAEQQALLGATAKTLVYAAEQMYGAGRGAEKLDYVIGELRARGFDADRAAIEAAVREAAMGSDGAKT
jgi:type II secretory pathway pseudopilin PulG